MVILIEMIGLWLKVYSCEGRPVHLRRIGQKWSNCKFKINQRTATISVKAQVCNLPNLYIAIFEMAIRQRLINYNLYEQLISLFMYLLIFYRVLGEVDQHQVYNNELRNNKVHQHSLASSMFHSLGLRH